MVNSIILHIVALSISIILCSPPNWAQSLNEQWAKCYGGNDIDKSHDIVQIGNYYYTLAYTIHSMEMYQITTEVQTYGL